MVDLIEEVECDEDDPEMSELASSWGVDEEFEDLAASWGLDAPPQPCTASSSAPRSQEVLL